MVTPETEKAFLEEILLNNTDAINAALVLGRVSQTMDDLIDKDRELSNEDIATAFFDSLVILPANPFYVTNIDMIAPAIYTIFADYLASVKLEQYSEHDKNLAFVLRDSLAGVVTLFACIVGGREYGWSVSDKIRQFFHDETLEDYKGGLQ